MQATVDTSENRPLLTSTDSASYGILSPNPSRGVVDTDDEGIPGGRYTPDRRDKGDSSGGRYTPVGKSFSKTADLKPKPVWQVPLKDYDVSYNGVYRLMMNCIAYLSPDIHFTRSLAFFVQSSRYSAAICLIVSTKAH